MDIVLLTFLALTAAFAIRLRHLFSVVMLSGVFSLLSAALFVELDAVDVAFTEAAVGAVRVMVPSINIVETPAPEDAVKGTRTVYFEADQATETTLYERDKLPVGAMLEGPAIVEQFDSTIVVPDAWTARVDGYGNLILSRERQ